MAAPRSAPLHSESESSDEDLERFREAAWEPPGSKPIQSKPETNPAAVPSLRVQADCHEHDGNELQTTPEFRSHIAKKLTAILDRSIKEVTGSCILQSENTTASDPEDSGFRLFCTSIPGDAGGVTDTAIPKRKVAPSSSDDSEEEEQRYREAAVSGTDILLNSALKTTSIENTNKKCDSPQKKKKQKKKKKKALEKESDTCLVESETSVTSLKKKKRRKHIMEENTFLTESNGVAVKKNKDSIIEEEPAEGDTQIELKSENGLCIKRKKKKKQKVDNGD